MVSEPLNTSTRASLGWAYGEGIADRNGAFTSLRLTADDRLFWSGSERIYQFVADTPPTCSLIAGIGSPPRPRHHHS